MESEKQHFRHILLFYYRKGKNAVEARKTRVSETRDELDKPFFVDDVVILASSGRHVTMDPREIVA
ncbi:hypothetical protein ALC56_10778 [Trachymyrmex septentrionalis]|uniref:Mos1 transposase HTH domain-containing protein n=1 Tax=Trachymyrmex septentrionalis TaxID=34720 RepID=A0A195F2L2_9HYME|nr:hypothetical protein ALC56_10778 [Trachymyrmex septentrionalis]